MRVIDIQTHYVPAAARQIIHAWRTDAHGPLHGLPSKLDDDAPIGSIAARLSAMDAAGVDVSLLSFAPIGLIDDGGLRIALCRAANEGLLAACAAHPQRFVMAAALPLPDIQASLAELQRIRAEPAVRAVHITAPTTLYLPDRNGFENVARVAADAGLPIVIHPAAGVADLAPQFDDYGLSSGMHAMVSHALVAARMIQSGMLDRIDRLELILTHLGGILPFLIDRLDSRHSGPTAFPPSHYLRERLFYDACGFPVGPALRCALETVGADRLLVGSDWPSRPIEPALRAIDELGLDDEARQAILAGNAMRWFDPARPRPTAQ